MATFNVSLLGQSTSQINQFKRLNFQMQGLQRQLATQKKYENYSGFGTESLSIQRYRMDKSRMQQYMQNISIASSRIQLMSDTMTQASNIGRELLQSIQTQVREGDVDIEGISALATQNMAFAGSIINLDIDGRYLFAGSSTGTVPLPNEDLLNSNIQGALDDWLDGTLTTDQLMTYFDNMTPADLGFDTSLTASGTVSARIDDTMEIDYTSVASENGFTDLLKGLAIASNMKALQPGDIPSTTDYYKVLDKVLNISEDALKKIDSQNASLSNKFSVVKRVEENHIEDVGLFETLIAERENVDTAEVVTKVQSLQVQLEASYQVTSIASQLNLLNFLR